MKRAQGVVAVAVIVSLVVVAPPAKACGPWYPEAVFINFNGPDSPYGDFVRGRLGVLQEGYARRDLFVAYRVLSGRPFEEHELDVLTGKSGEAKSGAPAEDTDWVEKWKEARVKVVGADAKLDLMSYGGPGITRYRGEGQEFQFYVNCLLPAFENAVKTLERRVQKFGAKSEGVRDWVQAQDAVFENCGDYHEPRRLVLPGEAPAAAPAILRADRAYQIAAAYFYAGDFDQARVRFVTIAGDKDSPWRTVAPLVVARCLIRQGTLDARDGETRRRKLAEAEVHLRGVLTNPEQEEYHAAAQRLLNFVVLRLRPQEQAVQLARALARPGDGKTLRQDLTDYTLLLDHFTGDAPWQFDLDQRPERLVQRHGELEALRKQDDLTDWVLTFQVHTAAALEHSLERWAATKSLPWLVAVMTKITSGHAREAEVVRAAHQVNEQLSAYVLLRFHWLRLLAVKGEAEAVRSGLNELLRLPQSRLPDSSRNLLLAYRMKYARNFDELLRYAPRKAAETSYTRRNEGKGPLLDVDGAAVLNRELPTAKLQRAVETRTLPAAVRLEVAKAAWVRAYLLGKNSIATSVARQLAELSPELKTDWEKYAEATNAEAQRQEGLRLLLKNPGLRPYVVAGVPREVPVNKIDSYRDNWWGDFLPSDKWQPDPVTRQSSDDSETYGDTRLKDVSGTRKIPAPAFLTEDEKATARKEWERLTSIEPAPNYLAREVLAWAKKHPEDARVPEALHLAVRATRYGRGNSETTKWSREAFQLLHRKYPQSEWAKKTKYWY